MSKQKVLDTEDDYYYDDKSDLSDILLELDSLGEHNEELSYLSQSE